MASGEIRHAAIALFLSSVIFGGHTERKFGPPRFMPHIAAVGNDHPVDGVRSPDLVPKQSICNTSEQGVRPFALSDRKMRQPGEDPRFKLVRFDELDIRRRTAGGATAAQIQVIGLSS